jgi:hypothetical protein
LYQVTSFIRRIQTEQLGFEVPECCYFDCRPRILTWGDEEVSDSVKRRNSGSVSMRKMKRKAHKTSVIMELRRVEQLLRAIQVEKTKPNTLMERYEALERRLAPYLILLSGPTKPEKMQYKANKMGGSNGLSLQAAVHQQQDGSSARRSSGPDAPALLCRPNTRSGSNPGKIHSLESPDLLQEASDALEKSRIPITGEMPKP